MAELGGSEANSTSILGGIYRVWFWSNYRDAHKNNALKIEWDNALAPFERWEIQHGLARWRVTYGQGHPPTPDAFVRFIRPKLSEIGRQYLEQSRKALS